MEKPLIALFSDSNFLAISLVENLLSKLTRVAVFSTNKKAWLDGTSHIPKNSNLGFFDEEDFGSFPQVGYAVFINKRKNKENPFTHFNSIYLNSTFKNVKTLSIFLSEEFSLTDSSSLAINNNLAVVYVGDLIGSRIDLSGTSRINEILSEAIQNRNITLGVGEVFYPIFVPDLAKNLSKWIFSFGPYGREIFLLGTQVSGPTLWNEIKKAIPDLTATYDSNLSVRNIPRGYEKKFISTNFVYGFRETFLWISKFGVKTQKIVERKVEKKEQRDKTDPVNRAPNPYLKRLKVVLLVLTPILMFPYLCLMIVGSLFYFSSKSYLKGNSDMSRNLLLLSKTPSIVGRTESRVLKQTPLVGAIYRESFFALTLTEKLSGMGLSAIYIVDNARYLFDRALGNEIYDPELPVREIKTQLDSIYKGVSEIQIETNGLENKNTLLANELLKKVDFEKIKRLTFEGGRMVSGLPSILGKDERKTYLVLFQNNMELRPTGGFIGSFGLLTFEGGRMSDFTLSDVYSADGQLKGHIEPPSPIRDYLGEANWFLRDSNWDPDFPTSARRAEWFLDKEIDKKVDGVISLDLEPVKSMVAHTGPIYLADYDIDVTSDNLYEKTQEEVHENVFSGTHKKASFLTALSRNLVTEVSNLSSGKKALVLKEFYKDLEERHIQIFLHDQDVQDSASTLGWSGEVKTPTCGDTCYPDFISVVEANVGVNKANYFIEREHSLKVQITPNEVRRELTLRLRNSANPDLGPSGRYKTYIRLLVPQDAIVKGNYEITEAKGRKEIGFLEEVLGGETKDITISWSTPRDKFESYGIYFRKQAGTGERDPLNVSILAPNKTYSYNTNLSQDFLTKVSWPKDK